MGRLAGFGWPVLRWLALPGVGRCGRRVPARTPRRCGAPARDGVVGLAPRHRRPAHHQARAALARSRRAGRCGTGCRTCRHQPMPLEPGSALRQPSQVSAATGSSQPSTSPAWRGTLVAQSPAARRSFREPGQAAGGPIQARARGRGDPAALTIAIWMRHAITLTGQVLPRAGLVTGAGREIAGSSSGCRTRPCRTRCPAGCENGRRSSSGSRHWNRSSAVARFRPAGRRGSRAAA